jgi:hypothetical protein
MCATSRRTNDLGSVAAAVADYRSPQRNRCRPCEPFDLLRGIARSVRVLGGRDRRSHAGSCRSGAAASVTEVVARQEVRKNEDESRGVEYAKSLRPKR